MTPNNKPTDLFYRIMAIVMFLTCGQMIYGFNFNFELSRMVFDPQTNKYERRGYDNTEIDTLNQTSNYISEAIINDIDASVHYWSEDTVSPISKAQLYLNLVNLPGNFPFAETDKRGYEWSWFSDDIKNVDYTKAFLKELKNGVNVIDFDYGLTGDSLIISVYRYTFRIDKRRNVYRGDIQSISYVHTFNCQDGRWNMPFIVMDYDFFPQLYESDYIRRSICDDIYSFLCFRNMYWAQLFPVFNKDRPRLYLLVMPNDILLTEEQFPLGIDSEFFKEFKTLPRDFCVSGQKKVKVVKNYIARSGEDHLPELRVEYKLNNDTLIIKLAFEGLKVRKGVLTVFRKGLGFYVHKYNCNMGKWEKAYEQIYL